MKISRRDLIKAGAGVGATLLLGHRPATPQEPALITRPIPSSGERLPVVGLGSADTFNVGGGETERAPLREVLRRFHALGGRLFDTAPTYGTSETVAGALARELGIHRDLFFATKVSTLLSFLSEELAQWGREQGVQQQRTSLERWDRDTIDLNQVHNLQGTEGHLESLRKAKAEGWTRYVGVTVQASSMYPELESVMRREELDFVQVNYSLAEREAADRILPLARDRGVAVIVNRPYAGGALFRAVRSRSLPGWAAECGCASWGQVFLKYILGHPAVNVVIPATSDPEHLVDNMGAGVGTLPGPDARRSMERFWDSL